MKNNLYLITDSCGAIHYVVAYNLANVEDKFHSSTTGRTIKTTKLISKQIIK